MVGSMEQSATGRRSPLALGLALALLLATAALLVDVVHGYGGHRYGDFGIFYDAGRAVLRGQSPYPPATVHALAHQNRFVYPAFAAVLVAPLSLLPIAVAATLWLVCSLICVPLALWLCGVRDWRCAAAALVSVAVVQALILGTLTPLLALAIATAWRWRERARVVGAVLGLAILVKVFLAPLWLWLVLTRRYLAAAVAVAVAGAVGLGSWAAIGLAGLSGYPRLLSLLAQVEQGRGYSPVALCVQAGLGATAGRFAAGLAVALLVIAAVRIRRAAHADERILMLLTVACLAASPIIWLNYLMLLLPALAVRRPRLSPAWLVLVSAWLFANANSAAPVWKIVAWDVNLAVAVIVLTAGPGTLRRYNPGALRLRFPCRHASP